MIKKLEGNTIFENIDEMDDLPENHKLVKLTQR